MCIVGPVFALGAGGAYLCICDPVFAMEIIFGKVAFDLWSSQLCDYIIVDRSESLYIM